MSQMAEKVFKKGENITGIDKQMFHALAVH